MDGGRTDVKRQNIGFDVSPTLETELGEFDAHRAVALNRERKSLSVAPATRKTDRERVLRFIAWLSANYKFKAAPTLGVFVQPQVGAAAERYIKELTDKHGRKYSYVAKIAASLVAVASFVGVRRGGSPNNGIVSQLFALHKQARQQARQQAKFDLAEKSTNWLDWDAVQRVRVSAEKVVPLTLASAIYIMCTCFYQKPILLPLLL